MLQSRILFPDDTEDQHHCGRQRSIWRSILDTSSQPQYSTREEHKSCRLNYPGQSRSSGLSLDVSPIPDNEHGSEWHAVKEQCFKVRVCSRRIFLNLVFWVFTWSMV